MANEPNPPKSANPAPPEDRTKGSGDTTTSVGGLTATGADGTSRASESSDPIVHQLLADLDLARVNRQAAEDARRAAEDNSAADKERADAAGKKLRELGYK